jgi:nucleoside-diphosphate-sugar epimerase
VWSHEYENVTMIIGSGLLASALRVPFQQRDDVCIFAAGVSNSSCTNLAEFERDRARLMASLNTAADMAAFVYFGTCSVDDPEVRHTHYVQHKLAMEQLVAKHPHALILRLPQLAGNTSNPHTLLNFLYARIARGEAFSVWRNAYRNIIDVKDVATLTGLLIDDAAMRRCTLNLANPDSYVMQDIVRAMEQVVGKPAIYDVLERGYHYQIDVAVMLSILSKTDIIFDNHYLNRVLSKYYEKP